MTGVVIINLTPHFPVVNGNLYRMQFGQVGAGSARIDANFGFGGADTYIGGVGVEASNYDNTANLGSEADMNFSFGITPAPPPTTAPIPTMSQWGLLSFGLLIMNISVFFVQHRALI